MSSQTANTNRVEVENGVNDSTGEEEEDGSSNTHIGNKRRTIPRNNIGKPDIGMQLNCDGEEVTKQICPSKGERVCFMLVNESVNEERKVVADLWKIQKADNNGKCKTILTMSLLILLIKWNAVILEIMFAPIYFCEMRLDFDYSIFHCAITTMKRGIIAKLFRKFVITYVLLFYFNTYV